MLRFLTVSLGHFFRSRVKRAAKLDGAIGVEASKTSGSSSDNNGGDGEAEGREMGFLDHLEELRFMLLRCIGAFAVSIIITFCFSVQIFDFMRTPLREALAQMPKPEATASAAAKAKDLPASAAEIVAQAWSELDGASKNAAAAVAQAHGKLTAASVAAVRTPASTGTPGSAADAQSDSATQSETILAEARHQLEAIAKEAASATDRAREKLLHAALEKIPGTGTATELSAEEAKQRDLVKAYEMTVNTAYGSMLSLKFMDIFSVILNIGLICGVGLSSVFILYFVGCFVAPALTAEEKKCLVPFCVASLLLFMGGCTFSFSWLIPISIRVVYHFNQLFGMHLAWVGSDYYSFVTMMVLLVGLTFQFPLIVVVLQYLEIIKTSTLFRLWRHVLIGILVASLVISPLGDPVSLSVLTSVLFLLYIIAASVGGLLVRRKIKKREAEEAEYERTYGKPHPRKLALETKDDSGTNNSSEDYGGNYAEGTSDDGSGGNEDYTGGRGDGTDYYGDDNYDSRQDGLARDGSDEEGASEDDPEGHGSRSSGEVDNAGDTESTGETTDSESVDRESPETGSFETTDDADEDPVPEVNGEGAGSDNSVTAEDVPAAESPDTEEPEAPAIGAPKATKDVNGLAVPAVTRLGRQSDLDLIE